MAERVSQWSMLIAAVSLAGAVAAPAADDELLARAGELARRHLVMDTHIDVPYRLREQWVDVARATVGGDFDYPRARSGGLDVAFMSIYTPAESASEAQTTQLAHELIDSVEALAARAPGKFMLVRSAAEAEDALRLGRVGLALGMENGSPINGDLENLRIFAGRGIRYVTLAHSKSNHVSDSSFDPHRQWNGLSDFGRELVAEMNRLGVMVDVSHLSDEAFWQVLEISQAPVIASHSSCRHFVPGFERNMSDEMIRALAAQGGVIQINFGSAFITPEANEVLTRFRAEREAFLGSNGYTAGSAEDKAFIAGFRENNPVPYATMAQVADHFDHVIGLVGPGHVGIGSDFDGVGDSLPVGLKDVAGYPNLVAEFLRRGYSEETISGILGGNLLRVWRAAEAVAAGH